MSKKELNLVIKEELSEEELLRIKGEYGQATYQLIKDSRDALLYSIVKHKPFIGKSTIIDIFKLVHLLREEEINYILTERWSTFFNNVYEYLKSGGDINRFDYSKIAVSPYLVVIYTNSFVDVWEFANNDKFNEWLKPIKISKDDRPGIDKIGIEVEFYTMYAIKNENGEEKPKITKWSIIEPINKEVIAKRTKKKRINNIIF